MEKSIITTGKTFDAAVQAALEQLRMEREQVSVQLLETAKSGVFGIGARPCKVQVSYAAPDETPKAPEVPAAPTPALSAASRSKAKKSAAPAAPKAAPKPVASAPKAERPVRPERPERVREERKPRPEKAELLEKPVKTYAVAEPGSKEAQIEAFLKGLVEHMGSDAVPHAWKTENCYQAELTGKNLGMLIGRRGDTLDAIQHLTNYAVNRGLDERVRVTVDAEDYRLKREESLSRYARKKAQQVLKMRRHTTLEPMNAYERHVIHASLQDMENISTHSTGVDPNRRVVIEYVR
jgi:spoIIIJ-associated protein